MTADPRPPRGHCQPGLKSVAQPSWEADPARPGNHTSSLGGREWGQRYLQRDPRVHPRNGDLFSPPCGPSAYLLLCGVRGGRVEPRGESVLCGLHGTENLHHPQGIILVSHVWLAIARCSEHHVSAQDRASSPLSDRHRVPCLYIPCRHWKTSPRKPISSHALSVPSQVKITFGDDCAYI